MKKKIYLFEFNSKTFAVEEFNMRTSTNWKYSVYQQQANALKIILTHINKLLGM